ncbi:hypothetical protein HMI54_013809 [Coelomomyces lativittatus]|nr:hypothetical protein HMI54_013809 [Coelomomyces lativittatus]KAJ1505345.1 hypothetical protein HMI56_001177 [Coelomomyces lativittatus]
MAGHMISREYALFIHGHYVSQARGEQEVFQPHFLPTAMEGCRSNALMRCCKDLGIASELWDPTFIKAFRKKYLEQVWVKHKTKGNVLKLWRKKVEHGGDVEVEYPYELMPSKK